MAQRLVRATNRTALLFQDTSLTEPRPRLTIDKVKELLGKDYKGERVDRFEIPKILAVHFLLKNHLDRGVASTSTYDYLGKNGMFSCSFTKMTFS